MKKQYITLFSAIFIVIATNIYAQEKKDPDEQIIVNKKFDDNGNLIQYDSTYVHQWSSDSTLQFLFPGGDFFTGGGMPDMEDFFNEFFNDSALYGFQGQNHFHYPFLDDEEIMNKLKPFLNDSLLSKHFGGNNPLLYNFRKDSLSHYPPDFGFTNPEELRKLMDEQLRQYYNQNHEFHKFKNQQQSDEWNKLMEKHQKEIEDFRKKWETKNNNQ